MDLQEKLKAVEAFEWLTEEELAVKGLTIKPNHLYWVLRENGGYLQEGERFDVNRRALEILLRDE